MDKIRIIFSRLLSIDWSFIKSSVISILKTIFRLSFVLTVISIAWISFIILVGAPPIDTTPALIMVWVSVSIVLLAVFPKILNRIKRVKVKDLFEIELHDVLDSTISDDIRAFIDLTDTSITGGKGDWNNLISIIERTSSSPSKSLLLVANINGGHYISIPKLFTYLHFLRQVDNPVTVLFIDDPNIDIDLTEIPVNKIIGAIASDKIYLHLSKRFPYFNKIFNHFSNIIDVRKITNGGLDKWITYIIDFHSHIEQDIYLNVNTIYKWFRNQISTIIIDEDIKSRDIRKIRQSVSKGDEYIIISDGSNLLLVLSVCKLTRDITKRILFRLENENN